MRLCLVLCKEALGSSSSSVLLEDLQSFAVASLVNKLKSATMVCCLQTSFDHIGRRQCGFLTISYLDPLCKPAETSGDRSAEHLLEFYLKQLHLQFFVPLEVDEDITAWISVHKLFSLDENTVVYKSEASDSFELSIESLLAVRQFEKFDFTHIMFISRPTCPTTLLTQLVQAVFVERTTGVPACSVFNLPGFQSTQSFSALEYMSEVLAYVNSDDESSRNDMPNPAIERQENARSLALFHILFDMLLYRLDKKRCLAVPERGCSYHGGIFVAYNYARICGLLKRYEKGVASGIYAALTELDSSTGLLNENEKTLKQMQLDLVMIRNKIVADLELFLCSQAAAPKPRLNTLPRRILALAEKFSKYYACTRILPEPKSEFESHLDLSVRITLLRQLKTSFGEIMALFSSLPLPTSM